MARRSGVARKTWGFFVLIEARLVESYFIVMITLPPDTEQLLHRIAAQRGKTPEAVVREAVESQARELGLVNRVARRVDMEKIDAITRRAANRPLRDTRSVKDILEEAWSHPR